ncbi:MAG: sulfur carrier protein ThiS [bacterium]|nr:sulfur carrier protein ThiS [bacterium]
MKVYYDREDKNYEVKAKNVKDMLKELKINKNSVIVVVNGTIVTEEYILKTKDKIKILSVVSGG